MLVDLYGVAYLSDFGLSRIRHEITRTHTIVRSGGILRFVAPEVSDGVVPRGRESSDIYSFAMSIFTLGTGNTPFSHICNNNQANRMANEGKRLAIPDSFYGLDSASTHTLGELLEQMWQRDPSKRLPAQLVRDALDKVLDRQQLSLSRDPRSLDLIRAPILEATAQLLLQRVDLNEPAIDIERMSLIFNDLGSHHGHLLIEVLVGNALHDPIGVEDAEYLEQFTFEDVQIQMGSQASPFPTHQAPQPIDVGAIFPNTSPQPSTDPPSMDPIQTGSFDEEFPSIPHEIGPPPPTSSTQTGSPAVGFPSISHSHAYHSPTSNALDGLEERRDFLGGNDESRPSENDDDDIGYTPYFLSLLDFIEHIQNKCSAKMFFDGFRAALPRVVFGGLPRDYHYASTARLLVATGIPRRMVIDLGSAINDKLERHPDELKDPPKLLLVKAWDSLRLRAFERQLERQAQMEAEAEAADEDENADED